MLLDDLLGLASQAEGDAEAYEVAAREAVRGAFTSTAMLPGGCWLVRISSCA